MTKKFFIYPIDKICFILIAILTLIITILIGGNKICVDNKCLFENHPKVKEFSWANAKIGAEDTAFILTFDRPMDQESVEKNLVIEPPLPGRISWAGKRLVYTLNNTIPYGKNYRLSLLDAKEKFRGNKNKGANIEAFVAEFQSRDRAFAYISSEGENKGKLIFFNSTKENQTILTPDDLTVVNFKFSPNGEYIVFSASKKEQGIEGLRYLQLYKVSTGISLNGETQIPAEIELILDNKDYQNNQFDLAGENGEIIVVQRINRDNPAEFDLWLIESDKKPEPLNTQGGDFLITPDGKNIAIAQGEGIAIIPLEKEAKPLDFLPKYGRILSFSQNGTGAAMVNFNTDNPELRYTKSLVYVNNQGIEKELLNIKGSIIDCQFDYSGNDIYCLLTDLIQQDNLFVEKPYFALINIKSSKVVPLVVLKDPDIKLSLAPDNFGILFDQLITSDNTEELNDLEKDNSITDSAESITASSLWLLTLPSSSYPNPNLEELPIAGFNPQWSP
jgi:WD40 repeat protein